MKVLTLWPKSASITNHANRPGPPSHGCRPDNTNNAWIMAGTLLPNHQANTQTIPTHLQPLEKSSKSNRTTARIFNSHRPYPTTTTKPLPMWRHPTVQQTNSPRLQRRRDSDSTRKTPTKSRRTNNLGKHHQRQYPTKADHPVYGGNRTTQGTTKHHDLRSRK